MGFDPKYEAKLLDKVIRKFYWKKLTSIVVGAIKNDEFGLAIHENVTTKNVVLSVEGDVQGKLEGGNVYLEIIVENAVKEWHRAMVYRSIITGIYENLLFSSDVWVWPRFRNKGLGRLLLEARNKYYELRGVGTDVLAVVDERNEPEIRLLKSYDYQPLFGGLLRSRGMYWKQFVTPPTGPQWDRWLNERWEIDPD